jgi:hypothetical protein
MKDGTDHVINPLVILAVSFKTTLLEKKLEAEQETLEQREAELTEVLARANLDPSIIGRVSSSARNALFRSGHEDDGI